MRSTLLSMNECIIVCGYGCCLEDCSDRHALVFQKEDCKDRGAWMMEIRSKVEPPPPPTLLPILRTIRDLA